MAITAAIRSDIIELSVLATNQATGTVKLGALVADYEKSGMTGVGASITGTAAWKAKYPSFQTPEEFGKEFLEAIVPGLSAAALAEGVTIVAGLLNSGSTQADVLIASSDFLSNASVTNATFGDYAAKFQNQAAVAEFHTITQELNTELVLTNITSDAATVVTAKGELDGSTAAAAVAAAKVISDATVPADADAAVTAGATANTAAATAIAAIVDTATAAAALVSANAADTAAAAATTLTATYTTIAAATADAADDTAAATLAATAATQATAATGYVTSATAEVAIDRSASTFSLTNALDLGAAFIGGAGDDTYSSVETVSTGTPSADTFTTGDSIDGGAGIDTLTVAIAGSPPGNTTAGVATANVERLSLFNNSTSGVDYTLNTAQMVGLTDLYINGGNEDTLFTNVAGTPNLHLLSTSRDTTVTATAASVLGTADSITIASNASALTASATATYNGIETVNLAIGGATGTAAFNLTIASADLENIVVTGSSTANLAATFTGAVAGTQSATFDASAATGNIVAAITRGVSPASAVTMGAGDDRLDFLSTISEKDVLIGGAGTDILEIGGTNDWGKTAITQDNLSGISGFETLRLKAAGLVDARVLSGNTAITNVEFEGTGTYTDSAVTDAKSTGSGTVTLDLATDSATDTLNYTSAGLGAITSTLLALDMETVNVATGGAGNTVLTIAAAAATSATAGTTIGVNDLTTVVATGTQSLNLTSSGKSTASVNASGLTGLGESFVLNAATSTVALTVVPSGFTPTTALSDTVNTITTGTGADTLTGTAFIDILSGGTGNDTITGGGGVDQLNGGGGNDSITGGATTDAISDGSGNDVAIGGDGIDTFTLGTGTDSIDGGAGNDIINAGSNLTSGDTIVGGAGTDTLTATMASVGQAPTVNTTENISVGFGASTFLDMTNITDVTKITVDSSTAGANGAQLKAVPTGTVVTVTDEATLAGGGNLTSVNIDTVADATLGIKIGANKNAATAAASILTTFSVSDATSVAFTTVGGTVASPLNHQIGGNVSLDNVDTTTLSITASAHGPFDMDTNDFTNAAKVSSVTLAAAAGGDITFDKITDASGLQSFTVTAAGASSDVIVGAIGDGTASTSLQTVSMIATAGGTIDVESLASTTSNLDSVVVSADGLSSSVIPTGSLTTTNSSINSVTVTAKNRGNVDLTDFDMNVQAGLVSAISIAASDRGTIDLVGFTSTSASTTTMGTISVTSATRGNVTFGTAANISTNGSAAAINVNVGADSTMTWTSGVISAAGTTTDTTVTVGADATTTGALVVGEVGSVHTDAAVTLSADATNGGTLDLIGLTFTALDFNLGGTSPITMAFDNQSTGQLELTYDTTADAVKVFNNGTEPTIASLVVNAGTSSGTNSWDSTLASKLTYTGGSGNDRVQATVGADSMVGGAGDDVLYTKARVETYLIATVTATDIATFTTNGVVNVRVNADIVEDTEGAAMIALINADYVATGGAIATYAAASDTITITYGAYYGTPGTATSIANGGGAGTQAITVTQVSTGTNAGNDTISGGAGNDQIAGGAGNDNITVGTGNDDIVVATGLLNSGMSTAPSANTLTATMAVGDTITFGNGVDIINDFVSGTDDLVVSQATVAFENTAPTELVAALAGNLAEDEFHGTRGDFVVATGVFTFAAAGADYLLTFNDGTGADDLMSTNTNSMILTGVTALVAGDFI